MQHYLESEKIMSHRLSYFIILFLTLGLIAFSFYLQYFQNVQPCPLCELQRMAFFLLGGLALIGVGIATFRPLRLMVNPLLFLCSLLGILLAARQLYLQHFPPASSGECGVSLQYMLHVLPLQEVLQKVLSGTADCATRDYLFLSLDLTEWTLIWFIFFAIFTFILCWKEKR